LQKQGGPTVAMRQTGGKYKNNDPNVFALKHGDDIKQLTLVGMNILMERGTNHDEERERMTPAFNARQSYARQDTNRREQD